MSCYKKQQEPSHYTFGNSSDYRARNSKNPQSVAFCPYLQQYGWCDYGNYCYYRHYKIYNTYNYNENENKHNNYHVHYKSQKDVSVHHTAVTNVSKNPTKEEEETKYDDKWFKDRNISFINNTKQQEFENIFDKDLPYFIYDIFDNLTKEELTNLNKKRNIIWLLGLPGAGKSTTIDYLLNKSQICDNYQLISINDIISKIKLENDNKFVVKEQYRLIIKYILSNSNNIIIDAFFKGKQHYKFVKLFSNVLKEYYSRMKFIFLYLDCNLETSIKRQLSRAQKILNRKPKDKNNKLVKLKKSDLKEEDCEYRSTKSSKKLGIITNYLWNDHTFYYNFVQINANNDFKFVKKDLLTKLKKLIY